MEPSAIHRGALKRHDALIALALARIAGFVPPAAGEIVRAVPFAFNTPSPLVLQAVNSSNLLNRACILITTAFDDPTATLRLGTAASPALVLAAADSRPSAVGQYESDALVSFPPLELLELSIAPALSTMGSGIVFYKLK